MSSFFVIYLLHTAITNRLQLSLQPSQDRDTYLRRRGMMKTFFVFSSLSHPAGLYTVKVE